MLLESGSVNHLLEERVLILTSSAEEAERVRAPLMRAAIVFLECEDLAGMLTALTFGAAAIVLSDAWLATPDADRLIAFLEGQPQWSELQVILLCGTDARIKLRPALERLGNSTLLEEPLRSFALVAAVRSAQQSRGRQYQLREHLREREEAGLALQESEERLRFTLDAGELGFWQHDLITDHLECSDLCKAHFGRALHDAMTHVEVLAALHPADQERAKAAIRSAIQERRRYELEYRVIRPGGGVHWLMVRGRANYGTDGRPVSTVGVTLDITQRKHAEMRQLEQAEHLRVLSECAGQLLATDHRGSMVGLLFERVRRHMRLDLYCTYLVDPADASLRMASCGGIPASLEETLTPRAFGEGLCGEVAETRQPITLSGVQESADPRAALMKQFGMSACTCHPLVVGDRLLGTLTFAVREQERFTDDQVEFLRTISHYVALAMERARIEEDLRETARRKDEFVAMLAHELRNPLTPILNATHLLQMLAGEDARLQRLRDTVERNALHLARLVNDLLEVSRVNHGKIQLQMQCVDLGEILEQAVAGTEHLFEERGHDLQVTLPVEPVLLNADATRLLQVVVNLLNNAAKYTDPGGRVELWAVQCAEEVSIHVRDNGRGMDPALLARIFDLFVQGEQSLDRSEGGLGIGLTLVKRLVEMHEGSIHASSEGPGRGSEFIVRLPL